jgi:hypothetical protein
VSAITASEMARSRADMAFADESSKAWTRS